MNEKMKVTMLFKTINYTNEMKVSRVGGAAGRRQLIKSLKHSLRIPSHSAKHLEWIEEMSHKNLIWTAKTGIVPLNDFSIARRESLLKDVAGQAQLCILGNDDKSLLVRLRTKLKDSIKKFSKREVEETTIRVLQTIINVKGFVDVEKLVDELACTSINRKAQKLNTVKTFLECHNEIEKSGKFFVKRNNAVIQEAFFKFPSRNKVAGILPEQRMDLIKGFYEQLFPDYPIHFIVLHGDEDVERSDYSDHPHIFLSAKSSKTGLFDLKAAQVRRVNSYLKRFRPTVKLISDKPDFLESQAMFGYLQDMFYAYTNNKLLKDSPYQAKKLDKTVEHMEKLRLIRRDSCKPKSQRAFNIYELSKAKELELNIRILSKNDELTRLEQEAEHVKACVRRVH
ncbi:hypothetical protein [Pseudomonas syringae]|uniref:hypothetical protein n=1 Tax=Pseudomonas syringae TaxID=317 RepID=UPI003F74C846